MSALQQTVLKTFPTKNPIRGLHIFHISFVTRINKFYFLKNHYCRNGMGPINRHEKKYTRLMFYESIFKQLEYVLSFCNICIFSQFIIFMDVGLSKHDPAR